MTKSNIRSLNPEGPSQDGLFGLEVPYENTKIVILPIPYEGTTSGGQGTAEGPQAIFKASQQIDLYDPLLGNPYQAGIAMLPVDDLIRDINKQAVNLARQIRQLLPTSEKSLKNSIQALNDLGQRLNELITKHVRTQLKTKRTVGVLGGEHSIAFGSIHAYLENYPKLSVLQIDAHADLRKHYEEMKWSHASTMYNLLEHSALSRLVQVGIRDVSPSEASLIKQSPDRIRSYWGLNISARILRGEPFDHIVQEIIEDLTDHVYISFDIDGLDTPYCAHTGTPVPGGLSFNQAQFLLYEIKRTGKSIVGFDLNEVSPGPGPYHLSLDANIGARMLYYLCGCVLS